MLVLFMYCVKRKIISIFQGSKEILSIQYYNNSQRNVFNILCVSSQDVAIYNFLEFTAEIWWFPLLKMNILCQVQNCLKTFHNLITPYIYPYQH